MRNKFNWVLLCLICGTLCYFSAPTHGMGPLAFVALVPLLVAVRQTAAYRAAAVGGMLAGAVFFLPALGWMIPVTAAGWIALALYCACYFAVFALAARWSLRLARTWQVLFLTGVWMLLEYARSVAFTGFPWLLLSHSQYAFTPFIQALDVVGAVGLGGVIVAINVMLSQGVGADGKVRPLPGIVKSLALVAIVCAYGFWALHSVAIRPALHVAAIQAAVPQEMKETLEGNYDPEGVLARYVKQTESLPPGKYDLVVWPETVFLFPYTLNVNPAALKQQYAQYANTAQTAMRNVAVERKAYVMTGATTYLPADLGYVADPVRAAQIPPGAWDDRYNSAVLFDADGKYVDRYDKMHLVPFGEYVPLPNVFPFLKKLVPFDESLIAGQRATIFAVPGKNETTHFGVLICYEDADAGMARRLRQAGADFIVNLSNDAWFGASELDQHFVIARFRAIENRVGVLRNGNNGITGIIDPLGHVESRLGQVVDGKFVMRDVMGHLDGELFITDARSLYSRFGDFPLMALAALAVVIAVSRAIM